MRRCMQLAVLGLILGSAGLHAKTAATRMSEFTSLLPSGKTAKMVWVQSGVGLKKVSSTDGVISTLVSGSAWMPCITFDGSRVIYSKNESECWVVNWDGTNARKAGDCGEALRYFRDRTSNTDWAITVDGMRFNIDNASQTQAVWTGTPGANVMDYTPLSMSRDGKYCGGHFPHPWFGVGTIPNGPIYIENSLESCYATMAPDNTGDIMIQDGPHTTLYVRSKSGASVANYAVSTTVMGATSSKNGGLNTGSQDCTQQKFEDARFTNDRGYAVFQQWGTKGNPYLMRLSDLDFMYMDELTCTSSGVARCPDLVVLPEPDISGVVANPGHTPAFLTGDALSGSSLRLYSIDGRRMSSVETARKAASSQAISVRIVENQGKAAARLSVE